MEAVTERNATTLGASVLSPKYAALKINAERINALVHESCTWGNTPDGGMSMFFLGRAAQLKLTACLDRLTCNDDDKSVRDWFIAETAKYGCHHKVDQMGNIFAIRPG